MKQIEEPEIDRFNVVMTSRSRLPIFEQICPDIPKKNKKGLKKRLMMKNKLKQ